MLWERLYKLNKNFNRIKEHKKQNKNKYWVLKMSFYSLPRVKLHKKDDVKKLNNFSSDYSRLFYEQNAKDVNIDLPSVVAERIVKEGHPLTDDVKNFC